MRLLKSLACASCLCCFAASLTANGPDERAQRGDATGGSIPATGRGKRGGTITSQPVHDRSAGHPRPTRITTAPLVARGLPSRRLTPSFGMLYGMYGMLFDAESSMPWDFSEWPGAFADDRAAPSPPVEPYVASVFAVRRSHAEPSSIQPPSPAVGPPRSPASATGTLHLDVEPPTAQVYVDGFFAGVVETVNAAGGLTLSAGWHRLEFRAAGYQTPAANVTIEANRTIATRLALQPLR